MARPKVVYPRPPSLPRAQLPPTVVKSAARALQMLEYFDDIRRSATVVEIAETLGYPQSSASALLRTLVTQGYLTYDARTRLYLPSLRVALLGNWISPGLVSDGALLRMMSEIGRRTGDSVMLVTRQGKFAQYIHVVQATSRARLHLTLGALLPLAASSSGYTLLSTYPDAEVRRILSRINGESLPDVPTVQLPALLGILFEIRSLGYCFKTGITTPGGGTLAMPLPVEPGRSPLVVGIGGIAEVMRRRKDELIAILREEIATYLACGSPAL